MTAGSGRVKVSFQVDADGLLSVSAREATTGTKTQINVKPSYGLTNEEVEQMLRDSIAHAGDDIQARQLAEQRVDADRAISALESALAIDGDIHLNENERSTLLECMKSLQKIKEKGDADHIKQAINELNDLSGPFAARRMNASIREAMAGHNIDEFSE